MVLPWQTAHGATLWTTAVRMKRRTQRSGQAGVRIMAFFQQVQGMEKHFRSEVATRSNGTDPSDSLEKRDRDHRDFGILVFVLLHHPSNSRGFRNADFENRQWLDETSSR